MILNDNKMGICPRVGGLAKYLDRARTAPFYNGLKKDVSWLLNKLPLVGEPTREMIGNVQGRGPGTSFTAASCLRSSASATSAQSTGTT